jgi:hypothetical protein
LVGCGGGGGWGGGAGGGGRGGGGAAPPPPPLPLKVHKRENFEGSDIEFFTLA